MITLEQIKAMRRAAEHELSDPRGHTWYNHIAARAVVYEGFADHAEAPFHIPGLAATRILQRMKREGKVRHIGGGKWARVEREKQG